ncbi:MAG: T9SS type A sorting domain-containing protein [Candidatus Latescibacteria bacterium]|nr:T9SS type A sorting domain-containing protein [Candidatus Latescibacterota bacterium]
MKKLIVSFFVLTLLASSSFGLDFAPTLLKIAAPSAVQYDFDNSSLEIPITITGTPASVIFVVFTKDQAEKIGTVENGFNNWHYVNKIDTCIYASQAVLMDVGDNIIQWDGKDADGNMVPAGEYTYYIWGFDSVSPKKKVSQHVSYSWNERGHIRAKDENGMTLARPIIFTNTLQTTGELVEVDRLNYKWIIGSDPEDSKLVETTSVKAINYGTSIAFDPKDFTMFFDQSNYNQQISWVRKWQWVPNGASILQTNWGEDGKIPIEVSHIAGYGYGAGIVSDGDQTLFTCDVDIYSVSINNNLIYIDVDTGSIMRETDLNYIWLYDWNDQWANEGPCDFSYVDGRLYMSCFFSYIYSCADPTREDGDIMLWVNGNGDGQGDNFDDRQEAFPFNYRGQMDGNWFGANPSYDLGAVSFDLVAPDGTGLGFYAFAGESAGVKLGVNFLDSDTPYDGIYTDNSSSEEDKEGWFFIGHDTVKGVLTSSPVAVEEKAPAGFTVAQNTPNPFNPTTTINFSLVEDGNVTIDVFNVAGQKIDTIADGFMNAGNHSVTWDASAFSAGVYFYTVKSGDLSRTMKMTLLK